MKEIHHASLSQWAFYSKRCPEVPIGEGLVNFTWFKAVIFENASFVVSRKW